MGPSIKLSFVVAALVLTGQQASAQLTEKKMLTLDVAQKMVSAAQAEAEHNHLAGVIAVCDGRRVTDLGYAYG
jgi:glc operon protein GlcG